MEYSATILELLECPGREDATMPCIVDAVHVVLVILLVNETSVVEGSIATLGPLNHSAFPNLAVAGTCEFATNSQDGFVPFALVFSV